MKRFATLAIIAAPIALVAAGCASAQSDAIANGKISFTSDRGGSYEIFDMADDGSDVHRLTDTTATPAHSTWAPGGATIAFTKATVNQARICLMPADGADVRCITKKGEQNLVPNFSPDGARIAFESDRDGNYEIYTMNADGSDVTQVTRTESPTQNYGPKYSPDGTHLLFASNASDPANPDANDLWLVGLEGTGLKALTSGVNNVESRSWAPDGTRITFSGVVNDIAQIFVMNADGSGMTQITKNPGTAPAFSPGGIFPDMRGDITPVWSPDGARIAYASDIAGNYEIYTMNPDGTNPLRLTTTDANQLSVGWQPLPTD